MKKTILVVSVFLALGIFMLIGWGNSRQSVQPTAVQNVGKKNIGSDEPISSIKGRADSAKYADIRIRPRFGVSK